MGNRKWQFQYFTEQKASTLVGKVCISSAHWNGQSRLQRSAISDVKGKMIPKRAFEDVSLLMSDKTAQFEPIFDNKCSF